MTTKMASQTMRMRESSCDVTHKQNSILTAPAVVQTQEHDSQESVVLIGILPDLTQWVFKLRNVFSFTPNHVTKSHIGPQVSYTPSKIRQLDRDEWSTQRLDLCTREKCLCNLVRGARCAPGPAWKGNTEDKSITHTGVLTPDHSDRSELSYRLRYLVFQN